MRIRGLLIGLPLCLVLTGCEGLRVQGVDLGKLSSFGKQAKMQTEYTDEQEHQVGEQMAATLLGPLPLHPDTELQRYVNQVGGWVATHSQRPQLAWRFGVIDTPSVNAFAMPGGYILITSGLLDTLDSEAELAAALAHEIAHIEYRHHIQALQKGRRVGMSADMLAFIAEVASARKTLPHGDSRRTQLIDNLHQASQELYIKGLSRDDERAADLRALELLGQTGYDRFALATLLQKLQSYGSKDSRLSLLTASHPDAEQRLSALRPIYAQNQSGGSSGLVLAERYQQILTKSQGK